jgi:ribonucleoside-diphosphate reductase subunit M2
MSDSPVKKLNFEASGKENAAIPYPVADAPTTKPAAEKPVELSKAAINARERGQRASASREPPPFRPVSHQVP